MDKDLISRSKLLGVVTGLRDILNNKEARMTLWHLSKIIEHVPAVDAAQKWISVQDRLPDMCGMPCLLYGINQYGQGRVFEGFTGYMQTGRLTWHATSAENDFAALNVTHWMPLPEPPKMDTEN